jgi:uncharacterized protein (TIGR03086 family)
MDPISNLSRAFDVAHDVFLGVDPDKWTAQSPCTEWDARGVAAHLIGGAKMLGVCVPGNTFDHASLQGDLLGADPAATFRAAADDAVAAFRADPSVMGRPVTMPFGEMPGGMLVGLFTADSFTHAWDLAKATGQSTDLDPELAETVLGAVKSFVTADMRKPGFFDEEKPAPADATAADRVAAYLGRYA